VILLKEPKYSKDSKMSKMEIIFNAVLEMRKAKESVTLENVAQHLGVSRRIVQEWLKSEDHAFEDVLVMIGFSDALVRVEEGEDEYVLEILESKGEDAPTIYLKDVLEKIIDTRFTNQDPSHRFYQATGVTLKEYMNLRQSDKILWHIWPVFEPKFGITGLSSEIFGNTQSLSEQMKRDYGRTALEIKKTGFVPKGAPDKFEPGKLNPESMYATVARAQAKKVFELVQAARNSGKTELLNSALISVLGEAKPEIWNTEEISFLNAFVHWAKKRKLINLVMVFEEGPIWKEKFEEFDNGKVKSYAEEIERLQKCDVAKPMKDSMIATLSVDVERFGYGKPIEVDYLADDDHTWEVDEKYHRTGISGAKYYDGEGRVYFRMEDETEEEFREWVENTFG
jgi:hypothetical protein